MSYPTQKEANQLLHQHLSQKHLLEHSRETEIIMRALAKHFGEDEDLWGVSGLLHDLDYEEVEQDIEKHGARTLEILQAAGFDDPDMLHAIHAHVEGHCPGAPDRESILDYSLAAAENTTGLIVAYVLMRPDKKIEGAKVKSLNKKFKDKSFAAKVSREFINDIEKTGLTRAEFFEISLNALSEFAEELGF